MKVESSVLDLSSFLQSRTVCDVCVCETVGKDVVCWCVGGVKK